MHSRKSDVLVIGSGMGSLTAAALLAQKGMTVRVLEQNWQPGGCTGSYRRKGFVFETGATTLVGMGEDMPLQYVLNKTGITLCPRRLTLPMQVHLPNGALLNRYEPLPGWIAEAERVFGSKGQKSFWTETYRISRFVWQSSLKQTSFPPTRVKDLLQAAKAASVSQVRHLPYAFMTTEQLLRKHGLFENELFRVFVNEQLLITAQNYMQEVNALFGATALCYTNYPNYYLDGGLLKMVEPFVSYIEGRGGELCLREGARRVERQNKGYIIHSSKGEDYEAEYVISGIPVNNTLEVFTEIQKTRMGRKVMESSQLNSAFQMGIGFRPHRSFDAIHHQVHLPEPLPETGSNSLFISLNHPEDQSRTDEAEVAVMSVSTHIPDPANKLINKELAEAAVLDTLVKHDFLKKEKVIYQHSSTPKSWARWTGRKWGFVGGYPQYKNIKPWQMLDARLDGHKAYLVGDTVYPGQGIPGVTLSGIIAVEKMAIDWQDLRSFEF